MEPPEKRALSPALEFGLPDGARSGTVYEGGRIEASNIDFCCEEGERIKVTVNFDPLPPGYEEVTIMLSDGLRHRAIVEYVRGHWLACLWWRLRSWGAWPFRATFRVVYVFGDDPRKGDDDGRGKTVSTGDRAAS